MESGLKRDLRRRIIKSLIIIHNITHSFWVGLLRDYNNRVDSRAMSLRA